MKEYIESNFPTAQESKIIFLSGSLSILIGIIVLLGWFLKINVLIQLNPDFVPMQFNTALCFVLSGLGYLTYFFKIKLSRYIISSFIFTIALFTLSQYLLNIDIGIDQFFMNHYLTTLTSHPGRMAPNTAICFIGISLLLFSNLCFKEKNLLIAKWVLSLLVLSLSLVALVGYVSGNEYAFGWQKYTRMAVHTSFTFVILSCSMVLNLLFRKETSRQKWLPVVVSISCIFCFTLFGQALKRTVAKNFLLSVDTHASLLTSKISLEFNQDTFAFKRLSQRIAYRDKLDEKFWRKDTSEYINDFGFYTDFIFYNTQNEKKWQFREVLGARVDKLNLAKNIGMAKESREIVVFEPAIQTEERILYFLYPVFKGDDYIGSSLGVVNASRLFLRIAQSLNREDFTFEVFNPLGESIYKNNEHQTALKIEKELIVSTSPERKVKIDVYPSAEFMELRDSQTPETIVVSGIILSIFLGGLTFLFQISTRSRVISQLRLNENLIFNELLNLSNSNEFNLLEKVQQGLSIITKVPWLKEIDKLGLYLKEDRGVGNFVLRNISDKLYKNSELQSFEIDEIRFVSGQEDKTFSKYYIPITANSNFMGTLICFLETDHKENKNEIRYLCSCTDILASVLTAHFHEEDLQVAVSNSLNAERAKSAFLANMSHEIRTPLNGIMGMTSLLKEAYSDQESLERIEIIESSSRSLMSIINDILDISKIDAGKLEIEKVNFNIHQLIKEQALLYTSVTSKKGVLIEFNIASDVPKWIISDSLRIRQILNNFISNAVKFTERGSVNVLVEQYEGKLKIAVKDSGIGISELDIDKLFQDFSQVDASTTRRFGGTGLGLSICRKLATLIGGEITVESIFGEGSIFTLIFPYELGVKEEVQSEVVNVITSKIGEEFPLHILVVDDNNINQKVAAGLLKKLGYQTSFASNGKEAVELLSKERFDLIFMDCHMPIMDGFQATQEIIKTYGEERPYIIALSASSMKEDIERCKQAGMDDFLSKPLQINFLYDSLLKIKKFGESGE